MIRYKSSRHLRKSYSYVDSIRTSGCSSGIVYIFVDIMSLNLISVIFNTQYCGISWRYAYIKYKINHFDFSENLQVLNMLRWHQNTEGDCATVDDPDEGQFIRGDYLFIYSFYLSSATRKTKCSWNGKRKKCIERGEIPVERNEIYSFRT